MEQESAPSTYILRQAVIPIDNLCGKIKGQSLFRKNPYDWLLVCHQPPVLDVQMYNSERVKRLVREISEKVKKKHLKENPQSQ